MNNSLLFAIAILILFVAWLLLGRSQPLVVRSAGAVLGLFGFGAATYVVLVWLGVLGGPRPVRISAVGQQGEPVLMTKAAGTSSHVVFHKDGEYRPHRIHTSGIEPLSSDRLAMRPLSIAHADASGATFLAAGTSAPTLPNIHMHLIS